MLKAFWHCMVMLCVLWMSQLWCMLWHMSVVWRTLTCPEERCLTLGLRLWCYCSSEMEKSLGTTGGPNISGVPTSSYQLKHRPVVFLSPERSSSCARLPFLPTLLLKSCLYSYHLNFSVFFYCLPSLCFYERSVPLSSLSWVVPLHTQKNLATISLPFQL